jgi:hypothetical protein
VESVYTNGKADGTCFQTTFYHYRFIVNGRGFENKKIKSFGTGEKELNKIEHHRKVNTPNSVSDVAESPLRAATNFKVRFIDDGIFT